MNIILELGIREGQRGTWRSWGISIVENMGAIAFGVYLILPLAIIMKLRLVSPDPHPLLLGIPLSKWWWFDIEFRWYRFMRIKIGLPFWRSGSGGKVG